MARVRPARSEPISKIPHRLGGSSRPRATAHGHEDTALAFVATNKSEAAVRTTCSNLIRPCGATTATDGKGLQSQACLPFSDIITTVIISIPPQSDVRFTPPKADILQRAEFGC